jgi:Flp pilus assembly protein TadD
VLGATPGSSKRAPLSRDHALFLLIGLLAGFLGGYIAHEAVADVQPQRILPGDVHAAGTAAVADAQSGGAGDPRMAEIQRLRAVLDRDPDDREALLTLANLNFDINNWPRAQELYERLLQLEPKNPDVLTDLGIVHRSQGRFEQALQLFRDARAIDAAHWQAMFNEAVVLAFDLRDFAAAESVIADLRAVAGGNPDVGRLETEVRRLREAGE